MLCVHSSEHYKGSPLFYFKEYFEYTEDNKIFFYKHCFSFGGFYKVGNKKDDKNLIIKVRDYRQ